MSGMIQGQGLTTLDKERGFCAVFEVTLKIIQSRCRGFPAWHLDLNAGSGINEKANCIGSPVAYVRTARDVGMKNYHAFFCEIHPGRVAELKQHLKMELVPCSRYRVLPMSSREALAEFRRGLCSRERNPYLAMGTILVDPNGYAFHDPAPIAKERRRQRKQEEAFPMHELAEFCRSFRRIDVILNLNVSHFRKLRGCLPRPEDGYPGQKGFAGARTVSLDELPKFLDREHWQIRDSRAAGGHRFVMMIGRNFRVGEHRKLGFYHLDSVNGQQILAKFGRPQSKPRQSQELSLFASEASA